VVNVACRALGLILFLASLAKLAHPEHFATALRSYALFPTPWHGPLADFLGPLEFVVGVELVRRPRAAARLWASLLFSAFTFALGWAWWHGMSLRCGCFGWPVSQLHSYPPGLSIHLFGNLSVTLALLHSLVAGKSLGVVAQKA